MWKRLKAAVDFQDVLYVLGGLFISAGCWFVYPPSAWFSAGLFLALPALLTMFRTGDQE